MRPLALILGRAGSKGLPGKNLALIAGRECVRWTIDRAKESQSIARIALSTDSPDMMRIAVEMGADAVARPADLASDTATVDAAARHAVESLADESLDPIVILYANVPIRPAGLIDRAVRTLIETRADSVQSYAPVGKHHPWWTARISDTDSRVAPWEGEVLNHGVFRRQDLPPAHIPDGGVLAVTRSALFLGAPGAAGPHAFLGRDRRGVLTREGDVIDIDSRIDLLVADAILREQARAMEEGEPRS